VCVCVCVCVRLCVCMCVCLCVRAYSPVLRSFFMHRLYRLSYCVYSIQDNMFYISQCNILCSPPGRLSMNTNTFFFKFLSLDPHQLFTQTIMTRTILGNSLQYITTIIVHSVCYTEGECVANKHATHLHTQTFCDPQQNV